jgi:hypothetical protein
MKRPKIEVELYDDNDPEAQRQIREWNEDPDAITFYTVIFRDRPAEVMDAETLLAMLQFQKQH